MTTKLTITLEDSEKRRIQKAVAARTNNVRQKKAELFSNDPRGRDTAELSETVKPENVDVREATNAVLQYGLKELED